MVRPACLTLRPARVLALVVGALVLPGCRSLSLQDLPWPSQLAFIKNFLAEREEVSYYPTARENFRRGMELYIKEDWQDATKYFDYVRTKFPHSRYAVVAELRLADAHFGREKWLDAIDAYRAFIRLHPVHDGVPYATFQIAKSYYRQIPEDWFFLPPVSERDQSAAQDTVRAFDDFLIRFPDHERAEEARKLRKEARARLADHEWYAAGYYAGSHAKGAAYRYERIADLYPDVDDAPEGLLRAARIWEQEGDLARARLDFERVARDYPKFSGAKAARRSADRLALRLEQAQRALEAADGGTPSADGGDNGPRDADVGDQAQDGGRNSAWGGEPQPVSDEDETPAETEP